MIRKRFIDMFRASSSRRTGVWAGLAPLILGLGLCSQAVLGGQVELLPIRASGPHIVAGDEIILPHGDQRVFFEIRISDWDTAGDGSTLLKAWEADIDVSGYSSGTQGMLTPTTHSCSTDRECREAFGGICSITGIDCLDDADCQFTPVEKCQGSRCGLPLVGTPEFCEPGFIFVGRTDYIYLSTPDLPAVDISTINFRYASAVSVGDGIEDPGVPTYAGTLVLDVPANARGTFQIGFVGLPSSSLIDEDNLFVSNHLLPAKVTITAVCDRPAACIDPDACTDDQCGCIDAGCLPAEVCTNVPNYDTSSFACTRDDGSLCDLPTGWWGDFNDDGSIDIADYQFLQACFGSTAFGFCDRVIMDDRCEVEMRDYIEYSEVLTGPHLQP